MSTQSAVRASQTDFGAATANDALSASTMRTPLADEMPVGVHSLARLPEIALATTPAPALSGVVIQTATYALRALLAWRRRSGERRQLMALDDRMLRDLGVSRRDVERY